jgi:hypothetical protein
VQLARQFWLRYCGDTSTLGDDEAEWHARLEQLLQGSA